MFCLDSVAAFVWHLSVSVLPPQLKFTMDESSNAAATSEVVRDSGCGTIAKTKAKQRSLKDGGLGVPKGRLPAVGDKVGAVGLAKQAGDRLQSVHASPLGLLRCCVVAS